MKEIKIPSMSRNKGQMSGFLCDNLDCNTPLEAPVEDHVFAMQMDGESYEVNYNFCQQCKDMLFALQNGDEVKITVI